MSTTTTPSKPPQPTHNGPRQSGGSPESNNPNNSGGSRQGGGNRDRKQSMAKKRRRRKKQSSGHAPAVPQINLQPGEIPADEQLIAEVAELEASLDAKARAKFEKAKKDGWSLMSLQKLPMPELLKIAEKEGVEHARTCSKQQLVFEVLKGKAEKLGLMVASGTLELAPEGYGFLRSDEYSFLPSADDIYIGPSQIQKFELRRGQVISGLVRPPKEAEKYFAMLRVESVNGQDADLGMQMPIFEHLTPLHPDQRVSLETTPDILETRVIDLVAPLGFGQRALIVAPPRTGKTVLLQKMAHAIAKNHTDAHVIVLLVDERPEEVTDFKRNTADSVEVVASTFDEQASRHIQVAELVMEKARRMVEAGDDVVVLLDSITRLARAYNNATSGGKIGTGGVDSTALIKPKKFFGSARNIEHGGSLTIIGTALVDTGSKADEVIFEEFKGTGNSELHLTRKLVEKRIWPAIDIPASGTRREELLLDDKELDLVSRLRKVVSDMSVVEAMELLRSRLGKTNSNAEFLMTMNLA
jgi:transcription termination factor Rho